MYKAYRFRIYPTTSQIELIHKTFGCTRLVYNYYLEKKKEANLSCSDMIKDLKNLQAEYPYLKDIIKNKVVILNLKANIILEDVIELIV